ncbi:MAG TPA: MarR family transcriptional regulator, partial [Kofleriaceae bacterium]|nr:MarR family transcriptional regulator [Kofleriaceae bacterium]
RLVNRVHNRAVAGHGVSAEQAHILSVLWAAGPITIGQLQRQVALSSGTLTGAIDRMAAQGMVRRAASPDDHRAVVIEPLVAAKKRAQIEATLDDTERTSWSGLTAAERRELLSLMDKAIAALEPAAAAR